MPSAGPRDAAASTAAVAIQQSGRASAGSGKQQDAAAPAPASGVRVRERKFENGDRYRGGWLNGLPEGDGKYEWSDGSCYEGGWKAGHKHGVGKYTWNSGASYQGEWRNGFMHGVGTFEAPDGSKYQGGWCEDLKHGLGRKIYANGDVYEGLWFYGKPDGPGRYIWVDFNEYDGEWRAGRLHGQGTFVWKTGERYDGEWKAGQEDGVGMFTFRDGSTFEGFWSKGKKHGVGVFRPAAAAAPRSLTGRASSPGKRAASGHSHPGTGRSAFADATAAAAALPDEAAADYVTAKRPNKPVQEAGGTGDAGLQQQQQQSGSTNKNAGSMTQLEQRSLSSAQSAASRARRDQVTLKEYHEGRLVRQQVLSAQQISGMASALVAPPDSATVSSGAGGGAAASSSSSSRQHVTPLGEVLYKQHSAYDLMVQLQLGIRWSVTSAALDYTSPAALQTGLQPPDYATTITQEFPRAGSRSTPVHPATDFVWKDYAPAAFRMLREAAGVEQHDYINQLCGDQALHLLAPPTSSHSSSKQGMFFLSADGRFLVRTISCAEKKQLLSGLQRFTEHMQRHPSSLLARIFGLHRVSAPAGGGVRKKVRFIVMSNVLCTNSLPVTRRYELKGCTKGRTAGPAALKAPSPSTVLKDLDLRQRFKLQQEGLARALHDQLDADTRLLCSLRVMDYSLLVGVVVQQDQQSLASAAVTGAGDVQQQPVNFVEHSTAADVSAAVSRLEQQLPQLQLDKWAHSALLQLARANLLMGLAASSGKAGGSRRSSATRSPTLVLATRPHRGNSRRQAQPAAAGAAGQPGAAAAPAAAAAAGAGAARSAPAQNSNGRSLQQPLGMGVSAVAVPLTGSATSSSKQQSSNASADGSSKQQQHQEEAVLLYLGVIDFLQAYTVKKRLESIVRRLVSSANAISAVGPGFYADRFRRAMRKVLLPASSQQQQPSP